MSFESITLEKSSKARFGRLSTRQGTIETPAFFPVVNLIGGTTPQSGGIWSRTRNRLFANEDFQGAMFQAMSFLDFNVTPDNLDQWRTQPLHKWFTDREPRDNAKVPPVDFTQPLFIDSGGYKLMNAQTFGKPPEKGGDENDWGIYTNPESILKLQLDFGADIIATLDYPIPPKLNDDEAKERMEKSIKSAKECLSLIQEEALPQLEERDEPPEVFVAIHGQDYEQINWYVRRVLDEIEGTSLLDGFAVGSLVPHRSNIETLIDIVQGAKEAIPEDREDDLALHVFGISGDLFALFSLLGVDSFDSSSYVQSAQYRKFVEKNTWTRHSFDELSEKWECNCDACSALDFDLMKKTLKGDLRGKSDSAGYLKSDYYALIAMHNFQIYQEEINQIRSIIRSDGTSLLEYVANQAQSRPKIREGLKYAQHYDRQLTKELQSSSIPSTEKLTISQIEQQTLTEKDDGPKISLKHSPSDFDVFSLDHKPPSRPVLLVLPCSRTKPYSQSWTHKTVAENLEGLEDVYYKISVSGLFGPVPETLEETEPLLSYDYVLSGVDKNQRSLVVNRLSEYLSEFGDQFKVIIGYAASKAYRGVIEESFSKVDLNTRVLPSDINSKQITEHFRGENLTELRKSVEEAVTAEDTNIAP